MSKMTEAVGAHTISIVMVFADMAHGRINGELVFEACRAVPGVEDGWSVGYPIGDCRYAWPYKRMTKGEAMTLMADLLREQAASLSTEASA
jgi:hypothetical protein